jgi:hypothetical protein
MKLVKGLTSAAPMSNIQTQGQPTFRTKNNVFIKRGVNVRCFATLRADIMDAIPDEYIYFMKLAKESELLRRQCPTSRLQANRPFNQTYFFIKRDVNV